MGLFHFVRRIARHPANRGRRIAAIARAAWWELRGRPEIEIRMFGGARILCQRGSGVAMGLVYYSGRPEYHEMGLVAHLLRPGDRFIDAGANAGYYTLLAATIVGPSGSVESFEPGLPALGRLRANIARNALANVRVHEVALSAGPGEGMYLDGRDTENRLAVAGEHGIAVRTERLDDMPGEAPCAMAKVDVEGAEGLVLQGAEGMLSRSNPPVWLLEVGKRLGAFGWTEEKLAGWLGERGYDLGLYDADRREFRFGAEPWRERPNVVAVARSARERVAELVRR